MNNPFTNYTPTVVTAKSFRESLINEFIDNIKTERIGTKWEVLDDKKFKKGVAIKINMNPTLKESWQLESFLKRCKESKSFGACFYGLLKVK